MSNYALTYIRHRKTSPAGVPLVKMEKVVWHWMADYADARGQAWVSLATIADDLLISMDTLTRIVTSLQEKGCISIAQKYKRARGEPGYLWQVISEDVAAAENMADVDGIAASNPQPVIRKTTVQKTANEAPVIRKTDASNPQNPADLPTRAIEAIEAKEAWGSARRTAITVGSGTKVAARAGQLPLVKGSTEIRTTTNVGQARVIENFAAPATAPDWSLPYLATLDAMACVGPLKGKAATANCLDRRIRNVQKLHDAGIPPSALEAYAESHKNAHPDAFRDSEAVAWVLAQQAPTARPTGKPNVQQKIAVLRQMRKVQTDGNGQPATAPVAANRLLPGARGLPRPSV